MARLARKRPRPPDPHARERSLDALALSRREGISLTRASRLTGTTARTVLRYAPSGFRREGRRWVPTAFDRIARGITVLTSDGPAVVVVHDSRTASDIARHANAVRRYLETGDESALRALRRRHLQVGGQRIDLPVDPAVVDRLAAGGELHYELYRR